LSLPLAQQVSEQLTQHDALGAHTRDELGLSAALGARPVQAALASAGSFSAGALLPLAVTVLAPSAWLVGSVAASSMVFLAALGVLAARAGGAGVVRSAWRVTFWGALAMVVTAVVGRMFGAVV
jgi:vacuolar iron transporter family protein